MTEPRIRISMIVCTRDRGAVLPPCLSAFAAMDFDASSWELVIVDNGSTDNTAEVIRQFADTAVFRTIHVTEPVQGLSRARNRGITMASGAIIAFTDDDCYVAPDFLTQVEAGFAADPSCGYIGGRILLHDPADAPETIKLDEAPEEAPPFTCIRPGFIHGANLSVRREAMASIGGFDPLLGPGTPFCADDIDLIGRLSTAGWKGLYLPGPVVRHHHGRQTGSEVSSLRLTYARGRGAYYAKGCVYSHRRLSYARNWLRHLSELVQQGQASTASRELAAGVAYLWRKLTAPSSQSRMVGANQTAD